MDDIVILCSGGLDSSVLAHLYSSLNYNVHLLYICRGSLNQEAEIAKVKALSMKLNCKVQYADMSLPWCSDAITMGGKDGYYEPMRNLVLASMGISYAEKIGAKVVALGFIDVPEQYNDTNKVFLEDIRVLALNSSLIHVEAPLINLTKEEVYELGKKFGLDINDTISCSTPLSSGKPCGKCADCKDIESLLARRQSTKIDINDVMLI